MTVVKKQFRFVEQRRNAGVKDGYSPMIWCFIEKATQAGRLIGCNAKEIMDESTLRKLCLRMGMPKRQLRSASVLGKLQRDWIRNVINKVRISNLKNTHFFKNLYTLAKQTSSPRLCFRLYLFIYLKTICAPFREVIDNLLCEFEEGGNGLTILLEVLNINEDEVRWFIQENGLSNSLLVDADEHRENGEYATLSMQELLASLTIPTSYLSAIQALHQLESMEHLIRYCFQLESNCVLSPKNFDSNQFDSLYLYLSAAVEQKLRGVNILLHGKPGVGKTELSRSLAKSLRCDLFDISNSKSHKSRNENLSEGILAQMSLAIAVCHSLDNIIMLMDECDDFFHEDPFAGRSLPKKDINSILEENPIPVIWITNRASNLEDAYLRRFDMVVEVTDPDQEAYEVKIRKLSRGLRLSSDFISDICKHEKLSIAHMEKAIKVTKSLCLSASSAELKISDLLNGYLNAGRHAKLKFNEQSSLVEYDLNLTNCIGTKLSEVKSGINNLGEARLLLFGPPGTGKSAYAAHLAEDLNLQLLKKKASDLISPYVGETEQNIAKAFEEAGEKNAILLMDEVDSFLSSRESHSNSWESTMVNEMLTQMESFSGVFIATTNFNQKLDHAIARRFDFKIKLDYLTQTQRFALFKQLVPSPTENIWQRLSFLVNLTPGDFAVIARKSALIGDDSEAMMLLLLQQESAYKLPEGRSIGFLQ